MLIALALLFNSKSQARNNVNKCQNMYNQVGETSVTVNNNSSIQDYVDPDDQTQPFE